MSEPTNKTLDDLHIHELLPSTPPWPTSTCPVCGQGFEGAAGPFFADDADGEHTPRNYHASCVFALRWPDSAIAKRVAARASDGD